MRFLKSKILKRFVFIIIIVFGNCFFGFAQVGFERTYGNSNLNETPEDIIELYDGNLVVTGWQTKCNPWPNIYCYSNGIFIKMDKTNGSLIIDNPIIIGDSTLSPGYNHISIQNNKIILSGILDQLYPLPQLHLLTKLNQYGDTIWNKTDFNLPDTPSNIRESIIVNNIYSSGDRYYNPTLFCTDTNGNTLFTSEINGPFMYGKQTKGMLYLPQDSTFIIAGDGNFSVAVKDKWMIRFKNNGDTVFTKTLTNWGSGWATDLCESFDSNSFYIAGNSISRFTIDGQLVWEKYYNEFVSCLSMQKTYDGNYILGGYDGGWVLTKMDTAGNVIWSKEYFPFTNIQGNNGLIKAIPLQDGGYAMLGFVAKDIGVIKVDSLGELHYATSINPITKFQEDLLLYPNPTNGIFNLSKIIEHDVKNIQVLNINGQIIRDYKSYQEQIDITELTSGTYIVNIKLKNKTINRKVIKE